MNALHYLFAWLVVFAPGCSDFPENQQDEENDDTSSATDSDTETASGACNGECARGEHTSCTCSAQNPCHWLNNDFCDERRCVEAGHLVHFRDINDCCVGECAALSYTACTCRADDPCGWTGDFFCDETRCVAAGFNTHFSEPDDCCNGSCHPSDPSYGYNDCTCGIGDRCGWSGDGVCDEPHCTDAGVDPHFIDDDCP